MTCRLHHRTKFAAQPAEFGKRFLEDRWELQEAERVTGRSSIKDDDGVFHGVDVSVGDQRFES